MPPIPSLPTDNLYKFLAFSGLVLLVVGIVGPQYVDHNYQQLRIQRYEAAMAGLHEKVRWSLDVQIRALQVGDKSTIEGRKHLEDFVINEIGRQTDQAAKDIDTYTVQADIAIVTMMMGGCAGFFLMVGGFAAWFFRVQLPQDRKLWAELRLAQLEIKEQEQKTPPAAATTALAVLADREPGSAVPPSAAA